jgi:CTP:molybdopterin cytidylyltransferase MocA
MIAVITAGGRVDGRFAETIGTDVKALARISGMTLADAAIDAARGAGAERIAIVGGTEIRAHCESRVDEIIGEDVEGRENLRRAICSAVDRPLLLMTSDMPFVEAGVLRTFLERAGGADVALPLASESAYEAAYPGAPPHVTAIGNERVANGNVVFFSPGVAERMLPTAQRLFEARKSLWRMAAMLGPSLLLRFAFGRLRIEDVERRAVAMLGVRARAVRDCSPALCFDVDTLDDYRYAVARFADVAENARQPRL